MFTLVSFLALVGSLPAFTPFRMTLAVGFLCIDFIMLRFFPISHKFSRTFIIKIWWISLKAFSVSTEMIISKDNEDFFFLRYFLAIFFFP